MQIFVDNWVCLSARVCVFREQNAPKTLAKVSSQSLRPNICVRIHENTPTVQQNLKYNTIRERKKISYEFGILQNFGLWLKKERYWKTLFHVIIKLHYIFCCCFIPISHRLENQKYPNIPFRIPRSNKDEWVNIIQSYQPEVFLDFNSKILICDKHFNEGDILTQGINRKRLKDGALPEMPYVYLF